MSQLIVPDWQPLSGSTPNLIVAGTTTKSLVYAFSSAQYMFASQPFVVPANIGTGNVVFRLVVRPATGAADRNVQIRFQHRAIAAGEAWDGSYDNLDSGDLAIGSSAANDSVISWTETVANLGWVAADSIYCTFGRIAAVGSDLSGALHVIRGLEVIVPTA